MNLRPLATLAAALAVNPVALASEAASGEPLTAALDLLESGDIRAGCAALQALHAERPGSDQAHWAHQVAVTVAKLSPGACRWAAVGTGEAIQSGTTELIISQAVIAPAWFGASVPIWSRGGGSPSAAVLMTFAGLGLGIGGTYAATRRWEPTSGQAMSIYTGELLGAWYGLWVPTAANVDGLSATRIGHVSVVIGGLGGLAFGAGLRPTAGQVALIRGGAIWGTVFGGLTAMVVEPQSASATFTMLGAGTTVGVLGSAALGTVLDLRRGQVNVINLGGYAGTVVGGGAAVLIGINGDLSSQTAAVIVGTGTVGGLVAGALLVDRDIKMSRGRGQVRASTPIPTMLADGAGNRVPGVTMSGVF
jgi:hypothetical protein